MTRHKSHDERRAQILDAARACFIHNGYAHTRVDDIAKEAGLSKGGIYFHFKSKREIFDALLEQQQERTMEVVERAEQVEGTATERLAQLGTMLMEHFAGGEERRKFLIVIAEMGIRDPGLHQRIIAAHERYVDAIARHIQRGIDSGEFRDIDGRSVAVFLKMLVDGVEQGLALGYRFDTLEMLASGFDLIFNGLTVSNE